ncbi:serine/threonine-protein kinase [Streptomyces diacarni]|uniref:serine/threonine-protein kinase n=1 Tax=Streptomyces diacarni TaxID=2800381 RepID=UPI0033C1A9CC
MQPLEPEDPQSLGEYRLLRRLGAGGMGRVYLARSTSGRTVAVKVVHPHHAVDEEFRHRFRREVASARRVGGAWTAPVLDADTDGPTPWVATGYVAGPSLAQAVTEHGPLPESTVRAVGAGLAEALDHVHGLGLVHRDVKPSNVLLTLDGPRLIDFGIARAKDGTASLTSSGVSVGSPGYMAPEQILGEQVAGATDVFALGAVLVYAATGEAPFPGDSSAALLYHVVHGEARLDGLPDGLRETVTRALSKDPRVRPSTGGLAGELAGTAGGAAGLVRSGWLPGPIVEQVSRRAVELLELEPQAPRGSGPVPFTTPAYGPAAGLVPPAPVPPPSTPPPTPPGAEFGPPDPSFGEAVAHPATEAAPPGSAPPSAPTDPAGPPSGRPGRGGLVIERGAGVPEPGEDGAGARRGRRVSCTLVLSLACVVAAALFGTYFAGILPGTGGSGHDNSAEPPPKDDPPQKGSDGGGSSGGSDKDPPAGGGGPATVPKGFLGKWRGDLYSERGIPVGTLTVTIKQGGKGDTVATGTAELGGTECSSEWVLVSASGKRMVADASGSEPTSPLCAPGSPDEEFTLRENGRLRLQTHGDGNGDASGTLRKIG